jgi:type IV secretory pathway VirB2 component (pilin)
MSANQAFFPIATMARVLRVSTAGYSAWRSRLPSARAIADDALLRRVRTIHAVSRGTYVPLELMPSCVPKALRAKASEKCYHPLQHTIIREMLAEMGRQVALMLYVVAMAAVIVGVDFAFFRNRFWERLAVNIGIVLVFGAFYFRFLRSL